MVRGLNFRGSGRVAQVGLALALVCGAASGANAQEAKGPETAPSEEFFDGLRACRSLTDDAARLACFDKAVGEVLVASDEGEVQVIDKEEARATRRSLYGFNVPEVSILKQTEEEKKELFQTTIRSARYLSSRKARFTTEEGAVWELINIPSRLRKLKAGDKVVFKPAAFNTFFVRVNGQMGVRGKRVQ